LTRLFLAFLFVVCLIGTSYAISPSQNTIIVVPNKNAGSKRVSIPRNLSLPTVTGSAQVGKTLTGTTGIWSNNPTSLRYMWTWEDCGTDNTRTAITTVPLTSDIGHQLCFSVWAKNATGESVRVSAALTATVTAQTFIAGRVIFSDYLPYEYTYDVYSPAVGDATNIAAHKHSIQDAIASGIDGFQLDFIGRSDQYATISNMFEAAKELHDANPSQPPFWLYLAPDLGGGGANTNFSWTVPPNRNWIEYFVATFANHPNYFHYNSKPVLGSFMGLEHQADLTTYVFTPLANEGIHVFYIPSVNNATLATTDGTHFNAWAQANLGALHIWSGNIPTNDIGGTNALVAVNAANNVPNIIGLSVGPFVDTHSPSNPPYFEHYGGEGPDAQYQNAISQNPVFIIESPWNDLAESYSSPVDIPNVPTVLSGYPYDNLLKPHKGYSEIRKYYAQWFKTGVKPTITQDFLAYFYRTSPYAANNNPSNPPPWNVVGTIPPDNVYVTCDLVSAATLQINTGGTITTYNLGAGRNLVHTPFHPGTTQNFQIIRNSAVVANVSGEPIIAAPTQNNLQSTSGFAYGGAPVLVPVNTALPTVTGSAQVGKTLTGTNGTWTNNPTGYRYMWTWEDCGIDNTRTAITTVPLTSDIGHQLCFSVWANNTSSGGGESVRVSAALTATVTAATTTGIWTAASYANSGVRGFNQPGDTSAASLQQAASMGAKVMRVFVNNAGSGGGTNNLTNNGSQYTIGGGAPGTIDFTVLDAIVANAQLAGLKVIWVFDDHLMMSNGNLQNSFVSIWQGMATHYKGNAAIGGFDLWNEPEGPGSSQAAWIPLSQRTASAIRAIDPDHVIIWEPWEWGLPYHFDGITTMPLASYTNVVYSYHDYEPHSFTGDYPNNYPYGANYPTGGGGLPCFPGGAPLQWNAGTIGPNSLNCDGSGRQTILNLQAQYGFQIFVGELGSYSANITNGNGVPSSTAWTDDKLAYLRLKGMSWTYHSWAEWWGWDPLVSQADAISLNNSGGTTPYPPPRSTNSATGLVLQRHFAEP
jgi:glucan endo-1,3-alpha-glucosidase